MTRNPNVISAENKSKDCDYKEIKDDRLVCSITILSCTEENCPFKNK